jgi:hypothetical protein
VIQHFWTSGRKQRQSMPTRRRATFVSQFWAISAQHLSHVSGIWFGEIAVGTNDASLRLDNPCGEMQFPDIFEELQCNEPFSKIGLRARVAINGLPPPK